MWIYNKNYTGKFEKTINFLGGRKGSKLLSEQEDNITKIQSTNLKILLCRVPYIINIIGKFLHQYELNNIIIATDYFKIDHWKASKLYFITKCNKAGCNNPTWIKQKYTQPRYKQCYKHIQKFYSPMAIEYLKVRMKGDFF